MLHYSGMDQIDIHLCLNIERHISQEVVVTGMYSDKDIYILLTHIQDIRNRLRKNWIQLGYWQIMLDNYYNITLNELARSMFLSSFVWFVQVS